MCKQDGCPIKQCCFNYLGEKKGLYCSEHKFEGMVNVVDKTCVHPGCRTRPSCNFIGENKKLYCKTHKLEGMIDVSNKPCIYPGCITRPTYNKEGESKGLYCYEHKFEGMIDVKHKSCIHPGCKTRPSYNIEGKSTGLYCVSHKLEGMVDILSSFCIYPGCKTRPSYNLEGECKRLYCLEHKLEGMIKISYKTCKYINCKIQPIYNYEGEKGGEYCSGHKLEGMIDVVNKKCIHSECRIQPNYNYENEEKALYCAKHKLDGMINITGKSCKIPSCETIIGNRLKYEGYCLRCFIYMFPDKPTTLNYKTKERTIVDFVKSSYSELSWIDDKVIRDGCSKRRPDLILDLGYQIIIIEIDEDQHKDYECSCENKRIMEMSQDVGHRPIIFLRFNPDGYKIEDKLIPSCWHLDGKGFCVVKKNKQKEWNERLSSLKSQIDYWINPENKTDKTLEIIQLFYDC